MLWITVAVAIGVAILVGVMLGGRSRPERRRDQARLSDQVDGGPPLWSQADLMEQAEARSFTGGADSADRDGGGDIGGGGDFGAGASGGWEGGSDSGGGDSGGGDSGGGGSSD